jgi:c-di-GMP-binding flagellar brake protein YcgR
METMPMPLDALGAAPGGLDEFRVSDPREIGMLLRRLCDASVPLNLHTSDGGATGALVWSMDPERGSLSLNVDPHHPALVACQELVVVGYLDNVKLQFEVRNPMLVHSPRASVLSCAYPCELFRFQRRGAYRVRPLMRNAPVARVQHSEIEGLELELRVLDVSIGGCALFLPDDMQPMRAGSVMQHVQIELDADTRFHVNLCLQHVTRLNAEARGVRLGCEFVGAEASALRSLQCFIDQTQKRGKLLSLW